MLTSSPLFGSSPTEAYAQFIRRIRASLRCVADVEVFGSVAAADLVGAITFTHRGEPPGNVSSLRTTDGERDLRLGVYLDYLISRAPSADRHRFRLDVIRYTYLLLDREEREIMAFHWHPHGISPVTAPHLHISGARRIPLPMRPNGVTPLPLDISEAHIPTGLTALESVLHLLIRDFVVETRRPDWQVVLSTSN